MIDTKTFALPPLEELARRTGRIPRWVGGTGKHLWTVLHHHFLVEAIVSNMLESKPVRYRDNVRLYSLIHDLHEGITGDIPTDFKTPEIREVQKWLDGQIYLSLGIPGPGPRYRQAVKAADMRALYAESRVLGCSWFSPADTAAANSQSIYSDEEQVEELLMRFGTSTMTNQDTSRGVVEYVNAVRCAVSDCNRLSKDTTAADGDTLIEFPIRTDLPLAA